MRDFSLCKSCIIKVFYLDECGFCLKGWGKCIGLRVFVGSSLCFGLGRLFVLLFFEWLVRILKREFCGMRCMVGSCDVMFYDKVI